MACHTQQEIAEAVGLSVEPVNRQIADSHIFRDFEQDGLIGEPEFRLTKSENANLDSQ